MGRSIDELTFVYNADSGALALLADGVRKLLGVGECTLCDLTHGMTGERAEWRSCKATLGVQTQMLHRDEMDPALARLVDGRLPCVVARSGDDVLVLLSPEVIRRCQGSAADLRGKLSYYAARHGLDLPEPEAST